MEITSIGLLLDAKRADLEEKLKNDLIEDFDMEDLDKIDSRKDIMLVFKNPIESKYLSEKLEDIFGKIGTKKMNND